MRLAGNAGRKKVAKNRNLGTIAQLCRAISLQLRHVSTIGKKLVKQQYVLHMSPQYCELRPTSGRDRLTSLGHPCKFQLFSLLGSVTARRLVVGVSQTLRRWTEGATYIRQGDHHVGHWPTFLVLLLVPCDKTKLAVSFLPLCYTFPHGINHTQYAAILWPLYRHTCVSQHHSWELEQSFTTCLSLLIATSTLELGRRC